MKKILSLFAAALCLFALMGMAAGCDKGEKGDKVEFTVTVVYPDDTPAKDVYVQICDAENESACYLPRAVDEKGVAVFDGAQVKEALNNANRYKIKLNSVPEGYTFEPAYATPAADGSGGITIKLAAAE